MHHFKIFNFNLGKYNSKITVKIIRKKNYELYDSENILLYMVLHKCYHQSSPLRIIKILVPSLCAYDLNVCESHCDKSIKICYKSCLRVYDLDSEK